MINLIITGVNLYEGMAGTKRVKNIINYLPSYRINISNLSANKINRPFIEGHYESPIKFYKLLRNMSFLCILYYLLILNKKKCNNILYHYGSPDIINIFYILFAKLIGYKIVFDIVEDVDHISDFRNKLSAFRFYSSRFLLKKVSIIGDACIVISNHLVKKMEKLSKGQIPIHLIPISVDFSRIKRSIPILKKGIGINIFYGGSFGPKDGIPILIKAFEGIEKTRGNVRLILTGKGSERDEKKLFDLLQQSTSKHNIKYYGFLSEEEYYQKLQESDILCMTRINSDFANAGFPFKLGEFLATGKPVIATNVGDITKYLKHNENIILIEPNSISQLYKAIDFIIDNPRKANIIGSNGLKSAITHFNGTKHSKILLNIFETI